MEDHYETKYHDLEESHWWFTARRSFINQLIKKYPKNSKILDIGCSGGMLIKELNVLGYKDITGIDNSKKAIDLCKKRGIKNCFLMDGSEVSLRKKFDIIIASDVLEHIESDQKTIKSWKNSLSKNGRIICFVPAFKFLWSQHDVANQHFRRYNKKTLAPLFKKENMKIERISSWNLVLFYPVLAVRIAQRFINSNKKKHQLKASSKQINSLLNKTLNLENKFLKNFNFPMGVSLFIIAKNIN